MKRLASKYITLFFVGGSVYGLIETIGRGYTHWTMGILGGICFIALGLINEIIPWEMPLWRQMLIGSAIITVLEFLTGCVVNLWLGWGVWDYSGLPLNLLGQICLPFSVLWFFISVVGIILDDLLRYRFFGGEKPRYRLI